MAGKNGTAGKKSAPRNQAKKTVKKAIKNPTKKKVLAVFLLIAVILIGGVYCWLFGIFNPPSLAVYDPNRLGIYYLDVGQADSILLQSPEGTFMLIDAGTNDSEEKLVHMLEEYKVETIEYLVLTHPHEDHVGGADAVIENFEVKTVLMPDVGANTKTWRDVMNAIEEEECTDITVSVGGHYSFAENCDFTILSPADTDNDLNACSIVLRLDYFDTSFLFTGDTTKSAEEEMLRRFDPEELKADVLKVAHHGSTTSTSDRFLNAVAPDYAVISCGKGNSYGHPHEEILKKLQASGIQIFRTDEEGTVILQSNGKEITVISGDLRTPIERYIDRVRAWFS